MGIIDLRSGDEYARVCLGVMRWVSAVLVAGVVASSCTASDKEADLACGVFDRAEVELELGIEGVVFEGSREVRSDPLVWECTVILASGSRLGLRLVSEEEASGVFTRVMDTAASVHVGSPKFGMILRDWDSPEQQVDGFFHIACRQGRRLPDDLAVVVDPGVSRVVGDDFDYRQLAVVLTLAANGLRGGLDCGGPLSLSGDVPPAGSPERVPLPGQHEVCGVFDAGELIDVLTGGRAGEAGWFFWESPMWRDPASCQVWRETTAAERQLLEGEFLRGLGLGFSRQGAAGQYDVEGSRERFGGVAWGEHLGGEGYAAEGEYRLKVQCNAIDFDVFVGRYSPEVIEREEFVALFERWIRGHADSYCPVAEE